MFKLILKTFVLRSAKRQDVYDYKHYMPLDNDKTKAMEPPYDVKKGQFAVIATEGDVANRFVVELDCLNNNPAFLKLLEKAEEEFGFRQSGVLSLPCKPDELERALGGRRK
ncbi:auxin-responsive protein SAUR50-like [Papaver somniferum]|uniref:auxin-responsive protein SAUR50-like n=1 Tax=Papaver somniferum TaxID=3469 RepID=UPI000E704BFB|nr:auxin-responsive protein SAUR50-like [Papaver somniferum]